MPRSKKVFVVDTSLLLHDPKSILGFEDNVVVVPFPVLEELDRKKNSENGTSMYARQAIRLLDDLRKKGAINRGVETPDGGIVLVDAREGSVPKGHGLKVDSTDNFIISLALRWANRGRWINQEQRRQHQQKQHESDPLAEIAGRFQLGDVFLVTKDINLRVKAEACGLTAQDYLKDRAGVSEERLYSGLVRIPVEDLGRLGKLMCAGVDRKELDRKLLENERLALLPDVLLCNQCCIFEQGDRTILAIYKEANGDKPACFRHVPKPQPRTEGAGIEPRNIEQAFALALLMDRGIEIVTLSGIAGSGKTLIALLAGLEQVTSKNKQYEDLLVYRSNTEIGEPLGFLKGSLKQKFSPWAQPIHDILELLDRGDELKIFDDNQPKKSIYKIAALLEGGKLSIEPINHVRGRSFHYKYVVVDETQNFKPGDIKKVITRVGKGTKIVLTGDVGQIDNIYLDMVSNGLTHVIERLKGQPMFGHITMEKSERSKLAEIAAKLL